MEPSENPYAAVGGIVFGAAHVGRADEVAVVQDRVLLSPAGPGATAIVGPPRIGKSSLAYHAFMRPETKQRHPMLLPVWINVRIHPDAGRLFRKFVEDLWLLLEDEPTAELDGPLRRRYERVVDNTRDWVELQGDVQQFLKSVKAQGWRPVLILDEFDAAREVFQPGAFQCLRELAYYPEWKIGLVTTSRRELRDIVNRADPVESTFPGIFRTVELLCFDEAELRELVGLQPGRAQDPETPAVIRRLVELTGGHPYLASIVLDRFCGGTQSDSALDRIEAAAAAARTDFHRYYRDLEDLLRSDGRMQALLEILYGPQVTATQDDAERLLREGLIRVADNSYLSFSDHFDDYLRLVGRRSDFWQSWLETENALREVVETTLVGMHGTDWVPGVRRTRPKLADMLDKCAEMQQREQRAFGDWASTRLLDFTYPQNLYELMAAHWDEFGKLLGHDKRYWSDRFQLLSKVRNPMAHNRMLAVVTPAERDLFTSYCAEILGILAASDAPGPA